MNNDDQCLMEENVEWGKKKLTFVHRGVCENVKRGK